MSPPLSEMGQPYRLAVWTARMALLGNAIQFVMILILSAGLVVLSSRQTVKPFFITADVAANRVFRVEPVYGNVNAFDLATQAIARRYVILRETLDFASEEIRWREASWLASNEVSARFAEYMNGKESPIQAYKSRKRTRSIEIMASPLVGAEGPTRRTHLVEFKTLDIEPQGREEKIFQATIVTEARDQDIKLSDALLNPYGINVIAYTVVPKKDK